MACSDNTIRAGLTPKFRDVETLCGMLNYSPGSKEDNIFKCERDASCSYTDVYDPPVPDFAVRRILVSVTWYKPISVIGQVGQFKFEV
jgi:mannose-6-phosphate isomerase